MKQPVTPLECAEAACDTMMRRYKAQNLPPKGHFHYHQGVFLSGMYKTYRLSRDERCFDYIKAWVDSVIEPDGNIPSVHPGWLDDIQPGILLFPLWERTGDPRYKKALDSLIGFVEKMPRNRIGGLWHKDILPHQMWLDGLYMVGPFCAEYAKRFDRADLMALTVQQAKMMEACTRDAQSGLWYHAWDAERQQPWADPVTGLSSEFWGRSVGWVPVALLDDMDFMESGDPGLDELRTITAHLLGAVLRYQSSEGRWYQVLNKGERPENWLENSCSCLFVAAISKAVRKGILAPENLNSALKGFDAIRASLGWEGGDLMVGEVCIGTDVGDYQHYCQRPTSVNDLHGVGAFLLMCAELEQTLREQGRT